METWARFCTGEISKGQESVEFFNKIAFFEGRV
jgi:hypothetical protein